MAVQHRLHFGGPEPVYLLAFDLESQECGTKDYWTCPTTTALKLLKVDGMSFKDTGEVKGSDLTNTSYYYGDLKYRSLLFDYGGKTWAGFLKGEEWKAGVVAP